MSGGLGAAVSQLRGSGAGPTAISLNGVDFTVVRQHAEGLRQGQRGSVFVENR